MTTYAVSGSPSVCTILSAVFGGLRECVLNVTQGDIDATSDDSERWGEHLVNLRKWTMDITGLYIYTDPAQIYLDEHLMDGEPAIIVMMFTPEDEKVFQGNCVITSLNYASNFEDVITLQVGIKGTDLLVATES